MSTLSLNEIRIKRRAYEIEIERMLNDLSKEIGLRVTSVECGPSWTASFHTYSDMEVKKEDYVVRLVLENI